jgi:hypothetical protein
MKARCGKISIFVKKPKLRIINRIENKEIVCVDSRMRAEKHFFGQMFSNEVHRTYTHT